MKDTDLPAGNTWRERLDAAIEKSGKSARAVSIESGNGPGYVHSILREGKDPSVDNLESVCNAVPTSLIFVLFGFDVEPEDEEIIRAVKDAGKRAAILSLLKDS